MAKYVEEDPADRNGREKRGRGGGGGPASEWLSEKSVLLFELLEGWNRRATSQSGVCVLLSSVQLCQNISRGQEPGKGAELRLSAGNRQRLSPA